MVNNVYRFHLNGLDYMLRGERSTAEMEEIVAVVEKKLDEIRAVAPGYSGLRAATLAAIQLSEELLEAKQAAAPHQKKNPVSEDYDLFHQTVTGMVSTKKNQK